MLIITEHQPEKIETSISDGFPRRAAEMLGEVVPEATDVPFEDRVSVIDELVPTARAYGLETERQVFFYILSA